MCIACITVDTSWILPLLEFLINWLSSLSVVSRRQWLQLGFLLDSFTTSIAVTVNVFQGIPLSEMLGVPLQILGTFPYDTSPVSMIKNAIMYLFSTLPHSMGALFSENIVDNAHWICGVWCWSWIPTLEGFQGQNTSWATVVLAGWHNAPVCFCLYLSSYSPSHPLSCWKEVWVFWCVYIFTDATVLFSNAFPTLCPPKWSYLLSSQQLFIEHLLCTAHKKRSIRVLD